MPETTLTPRCTRCGSDALVPDAFLRVADYVSDVKLEAGVFTKPDALMMKGPVRTSVRVSVCGDCGFIEAEASEPRKLWDAYVDRLSRELGR